MKIRPFALKDFEDVVEMYYKLVKHLSSNRKLGDKYFFYRTVMGWVANGNDIFIAEHDNGKVVGFAMGRVDDTGGITEPVYIAEIAFVKEEYRNSRAAYMLYNHVFNLAKENGITIVADAYVGDNSKDQVNKIVGKFLEPTFIKYERVFHGR